MAIRRIISAVVRTLQEALQGVFGRRFTGVDAVVYGRKRMSPAKFHRSYLAGAAKGVQDRLKEERDRELQAQVQVNALVLRTDQKLNDYVAENYKDLRSSRPMHIGSGHAMAMGREDGRKVNITRGGIAASNTNPNQIAQ